MFIETKVQLLFLKGRKRTFIDCVIVLCPASKGLAASLLLRIQHTHKNQEEK